MDDFQPVAHHKSILHLDFRHRSRRIEAHHIPHILATTGFGVTFKVILVLGSVMAFVEPVGIAAIGQPFQFR